MITNWIITAPHSKRAEKGRHPYSEHPYDTIAGSAAIRIAAALGTDRVFLADRKREQGDLNRQATEDLAWHNEWKSAVSLSLRPCLLDIHSYDERRWFDRTGRSVMTILGDAGGKSAEWTKALARALGDACIWKAGSDANYIVRSAHDDLRCPATLIEFWEGASNLQLDSIFLSMARILKDLSKNEMITI